MAARVGARGVRWGGCDGVVVMRVWRGCMGSGVAEWGLVGQGVGVEPKRDG